MPKARSGYTKKRKFTGNRFTDSKKTKESMEVEDENQGSQVGEHVNATSQQGNSASAQKIHLPSATPTSSTTYSKEKVSGFRFVDIEILSSVFELL